VGYQLGVDLGTTFTAAAVIRDGRAEVVTLGTRSLQIPSVAFLRSDGVLLLAEAAERRSSTEPGRVTREFKRRLGDPTPILLGGTPFSAHTLMSKLLRHVVDLVADREGGPAEAVVVTRPANWGEYKRELLDQAIQQADLKAETVSEPEAAAIQYASTTRVAPGEVVAVYDLGGGTFDATVLRKTETGFDVLGDPLGIEQLGGVDFDEAVFGHVTASLGEAVTQLDPDDTAAVGALSRLRRDCVDAKEALSSDTEVNIPVGLPNVRTQVRLTRGEFEALIRPALNDTLETMRRALRSADVEASDLKAIVLVGGSSRIPLVAQLLSDEFRCPVAIDVHPKHAVALGAAHLAAPATIGAEPASPAPAPGLGVPAAPPATPAGARKTPLLIGGAVVLVLLVAVAAFLLTRGGGESAADDSDSRAGSDGSTTTTAAGAPVVIPEGPALDDNTLAFTRVDGTFWNVWLTNDAGTFTTTLTNEIAVRAMLPAVSPDRRTIAYTIDNSGQWELWLVDTNGGGETRVAEDLAPDAVASWSADGTQLAFVSDRDGPRDIYILDLETGVVRNLTNSEEEEGDPAWSPDGDRLAYWARVERNQDIYVMPIDGGDATRLTTAEGEDGDPSWHPNDGSIAFASQRDGDWEIYVMEDDGSGQQPLTDNPADDQGPTWSVDGAFIAFESKRDAPERGDFAELYIMLSNGDDQRRLTTFDGFDGQAAWSSGRS
jgi:actin-like ATPase involved in cell morphogenesis